LNQPILERSFAIAEERGDALDQVRLLGPLNMFHLRTGSFTTAIQCAERCAAAIATVEDSVAIAVAHSILGISLHIRSDIADARPCVDATSCRRNLMSNVPAQPRAWLTHSILQPHVSSWIPVGGAPKPDGSGAMPRTIAPGPGPVILPRLRDCPESVDADIVRASQLQHAVEDMDGHVHFSCPTFVHTRAQSVADHLFPSCDRRLYLGPPVVAGGFLSSHAALLGDRGRMCVVPRQATVHHRAPRHDNEFWPTSGV